MRKSNAVPVLVASEVAMVFLLLGAGLPLLAPTQQQAYPDSSGNGEYAMVTAETPTTEDAATPAGQPPLQCYAAECFRAAARAQSARPGGAPQCQPAG